LNDRDTGAAAAVPSQNFIHSSKLGDSSRSLGGKSLKPGDELKLRIDSLRSGAPGGPIREKD
jgi:hypothetical protein